MFRKIAEVHGSIVGLYNCKLEGNQNTIIGRVQIQSLVNGLINETMRIRFRGITFNIKVIEEVSDITEIEIEDVLSTNMDEQEGMGTKQEEDGEDMAISEDDEEDGESNNGSDGEECSDEEKDDSNQNEGEEQVYKMNGKRRKMKGLG